MTMHNKLWKMHMRACTDIRTHVYVCFSIANAQTLRQMLYRVKLFVDSQKKFKFGQ